MLLKLNYHEISLDHPTFTCQPEWGTKWRTFSHFGQTHLDQITRIQSLLCQIHRLHIFKITTILRNQRSNFNCRLTIHLKVDPNNPAERRGHRLLGPYDLHRWSYWYDQGRHWEEWTHLKPTQNHHWNSQSINLTIGKRNSSTEKRTRKLRTLNVKGCNISFHNRVGKSLRCLQSNLITNLAEKSLNSRLRERNRDFEWKRQLIKS